MSNESTLNRTFNEFSIIGYVNEMGMLEKQKDGTWKNVPLRIVDDERELYKDGKPTGEKIKCKRLRGTVSLKVNDGVQDVRLNFCNKTSSGEDDQRWDMAVKIANDWVPAIGASGDKEGEPASYVQLKGKYGLGVYDSVGRDGKVYSRLQYTASEKCQRVNEETESGCSVTVVGYLKSIIPETRIVNNEAEETGRLKCLMYGVDGNGACYPIDFIVEKEIADDFMNYFEEAIGGTVSLDFNRVARQVGGNRKRGFNGSKLNTEVGTTFTIEELIMAKGDIIEEPDELTTEDEDGNEVEVKTQWIDPKVMKKAIKLRQEKLDQLKAEGPKSKGKSGTASSLAAAKKADKAKVGKTKAVAPDDDFEDFGDDDLPF